MLCVKKIAMSVMLTVFSVSVMASAPDDEINCFDTKQQSYQLVAGDVLLVSVWQEEALSREVKVRPDGMFQFPLAADIKAEGHTLAEIRQVLSKKLSKFVSEPEVNVSLLSSAQNAYVIGKVNRPINIPLNNSVSILQALSLAGGMTAFADADDIMLIRQCNGSKVSRRFNYDKASKGKHLDNDIRLINGDVLLVP